MPTTDRSQLDHPNLEPVAAREPASSGKNSLSVGATTAEHALRARNYESEQPSVYWNGGEFQHRLDLGKYLEIPFLHRRLVLSTFLLSVLLAWMAILVWPRTFESEAKLIVRVGRESVSLDPTATTSQTLMLQKTQEEEINSALEVLNSREVAQLVVKKLGTGPILDGSLPASGEEPAPSWLKSTTASVKDSVANALHASLRTIGLKDDISDYELAVRRVQSTVDIYAPKRSTVLTVHAESKTPHMAQAVAREITDAFLEQHLQVSRTDGSELFFKTQSDEAALRLNKLIDERSQFMQEHRLVSIDANRMMLKDQLAAIDRDLIVARGALEQALAELGDIKNQLDSTEDEVVANKLEGSDTTWSGMRQRVYELELQEKRLASIYTDDYQMLAQTREQLEGAREILSRLKSDRVDSSTTPNPAKRRLQEELQKQQTNIIGLQSAIKEKASQRADTDRQVNELLQLELTMTQMDREIGLLETSLNVLREKLEEARVISQLQAQKISNISVFQPATFVERAASPEKKVLAAGIVMLGLMSGVGLAVLRQASSTSLRSVREAESQFGLIPLAEIPQMRASGSRSGTENATLRGLARQIISDVLLAGGARSGAPGRTIGILGIDAGAGASTLATSLALAGSNDCGLRTILVDADARHQTLSRSLSVGNAPGLAELLNGDASHEDCLQSNLRTNIHFVAFSGTQHARLSASSAEIMSALEAYTGGTDLVVIDLPPASQPNQITSLTHYLDGVILVFESGKTDVSAAERVVRRLRSNRCNIVGFVMNKSTNHLPRWLGRYVSPRAH